MPPKPPATDADRDPDAFFDADYRRVLEPFHPEAGAREEVAALRELLGLAQDDRILDLGCGWGRHLRLLKEAGHRITGLDRSIGLLRQARDDDAERSGAGVPPRLVQGDMLALPFRDGAFDVVLNLATSLGLFLDDAPVLRALAEARRVLRPAGRMVIEGMHRDDVVARFAPRDRWTLDDGTRVRARRRFDPVSGVSREVLRWRDPDGGGGEKRHALRIRTATELARLVEDGGFEIREAFGDAWGAPFRHDSERLVLIAARP